MSTARNDLSQSLDSTPYEWPEASHKIVSVPSKGKSWLSVQTSIFDLRGPPSERQP
jgi:hypothetical protein